MPKEADAEKEIFPNTGLGRILTTPLTYIINLGLIGFALFRVEDRKRCSMLLLEAKIYLDTPSQNPNALTKDLVARHILRPAINFGNDLLFSGEIWAQNEAEILCRGRTYEVLIHMFTIEEEAFGAIGHLIKVGQSFSIQTGSWVVGKGTILDYLYE